jgi:hypothetical protein
VIAEWIVVVCRTFKSDLPYRLLFPNAQTKSSKSAHPELEDRPFYATRAAGHRRVVRRAGGPAHAPRFLALADSLPHTPTHCIAKFKLKQDPTLRQRDMELT